MTYFNNLNNPQTQRAGRHHRVREQVLGGPTAAALDLLLHLRLAPPPHDQQLSQLPRLLRRGNQVCQLSGLPDGKICASTLQPAAIQGKQGIKFDSSVPKR